MIQHLNSALAGSIESNWFFFQGLSRQIHQCLLMIQHLNSALAGSIESNWFFFQGLSRQIHPPVTFKGQTKELRIGRIIVHSC
jgi:hypothetical protein